MPNKINAKNRIKNRSGSSEILDSITDTFFAVDADWRLTYVNLKAEQYWQRSREDLLGTKLWELRPNYESTEDYQQLLRAAQERVPVCFETFSPVSQTWVEVHAYPAAGGGLSVFLHDILHRNSAEEAVRRHDERLRLFVENAPVAIAMFDKQMRYLAVSRRWLKDFSVPDSDIIGRSHYEIFPEIPDRWKEIHRRGLAGEAMGAEEDSFPRADGSIQWLHWEIIPWYTFDKQVGGIIIFSEDITQRKQAELALAGARDQLEEKVKERTAELIRTEVVLEENLRRTDKILSSISDALFMIDKNWRYTYVNSRALDMARKTEKEVLGAVAWDVFPDLIGTEAEKRFREAMENARPADFEFYYPRLNAWLEFHLYPAAEGLLKLITDISGRKKAEEALVKSKKQLAEANRQLRLYGQRITQVQEEERKRIAYELHDDAAQYLGILKMQLGALVNSEKIRSPEIKEKILYLEKDADKAFNEVRRYSHELRPVVLEHQGLAAALEQIADDINKLGAFKVETNIQGSEPNLSDDIKLGLFRIAQEALSNTRKHARATQAVVSLNFLKNQISMIVADNGVGFDIDRVNTKSARKGNLGLMSMRERAKLIDAELKVKSKPQQGTKVIVKARVKPGRPL